MHIAAKVDDSRVRYLRAVLSLIEEERENEYGGVDLFTRGARGELGAIATLARAWCCSDIATILQHLGYHVLYLSEMDDGGDCPMIVMWRDLPVREIRSWKERGWTYFPPVDPNTDMNLLD